MDPQAREALGRKLQSLLTEAGLPEERELIGRKFAFTYEMVVPKGWGEEGLVRISGTIHGIELHGNSNGFTLITSQLPRQWTRDTVTPSISFGINRQPAPWSIIFYHNDGEGKPDINLHEMFFGDLELL
ncbi:MAG: hypothetical protein Q7R69_02535 [bacterium]|nr:hypothetical protein [bacterium]